MLNVTFFGSWLAYVVVTFALGFIWHLVLFKELYAKLGIYSRLDDPIVPLGLSAMLIQGAVLAYLYPLLARPGNLLLEGLRFGLIMGLFIASSAVLAEAAKQRVTSLPTWLVVETIYYAIQFALCGIAIAFVHSKFQNAA
jgi:hypothetical protein